MNAMQFWKKYGKTKVMEVCELSGTTYMYWQHIANGRKRPSVDLAYRLVEHSKGELTFVDLLPHSNDMKSAAKPPVIQEVPVTAE